MECGITPPPWQYIKSCIMPPNAKKTAARMVQRGGVSRGTGAPPRFELQYRVASPVYDVVFDTTARRRYTPHVTRVIEFDWDQWNVQKNEVKHGVSRLEAESAFHDPRYRLYEDLKHSTPREARYLLYGRSLENRVLMVGFTLRGARVRAITARPASRKERRIYESE